MSKYKIKQLSIFINNEPGRLAQIAAALKECNINMKAFNIAESSGFGVFRAIVEEPDRAFAELSKKGIVVKETDVIAIPMIDRPGGLLEVAKTIGNANINIEYGYAYSNKGVAAFFFRVDDTDAAIERLLSSGTKVLTEKDI
ncbi:MAG: acetolactate synthase [Methanomassiliicoccaceae archaeon]|nr:acetolactate synthase [Methanomassiliicoccaceae archaeon]